MDLRSVACVALFAGFVSGGPVEAQQKFVENVHYNVMSPRQPTSSPADMVEVAVVFMYICPHCAALEPSLQEWISHKPSYVNVVRLPARFNESAKLHARTYYAAEKLGVLDKSHEALFHAIHVDKLDLSTPESMREFFRNFGVEPAAFDAALTSADVDSKADRAYQLIQGYRLRAVPAIIVNGKYMTTMDLMDSHETWFKLIDELVEREHHELAASTASH